MAHSTKLNTKTIKPKFNPKQYIKPGLHEEEIIEIKEAFDLFDKDKNRGILASELMTYLRQYLLRFFGRKYLESGHFVH